MALKQSNIYLKALLCGFTFFSFSCTSKDIAMEYNKTVLFTHEFDDVKCTALIDSPFTITSDDFLKFEDKKSFVKGSLCDENSKLDSFIRTLQSQARLFYSGSFQLQQGNGYQITLVGHSGSSVGKTDGFLLLFGDNSITLLKAFSSQPEKAQLRSYFKNGFILITRTYNNGYDLPSSKPELEPVQYVVVKMDKGKFIVQDEKVSMDIIDKNFSDIEHY